MAAVLAETDGAGDDEKPTWDDDIDVGDIIPPSVDDASLASATKERKKAKKKEKKKRKREDDQSAVGVDEMDADAIDEDEERWDDLEWDGTEEMRKRVLDQYMEELYGLEFNDMVAGMPTRFRYTPVAKTTYALTSSEILLADDKDLNEYVGLKKLAPYRKQSEAWDAKRTERLREFKHKVSARLGDAGADIIATEHTMDGERKAKKRKGKKERMREKAVRAPEEAEMAVEVVGMKATDPPGQSNKNAEWRSDDDEEDEVSEPVKKKRRRQKRAGKPQTVE
ncbi:KRI1-like family C-terminal-domain-containing protein [Russula brevipes]|nr:KRI1-like family C-terminal-domain-containing protein [Russula brevipes]